MSLLSDYTAGTVSSSGLVITGTGTAWKTAQFREGDEFIADGWRMLVQSVDSETQITLRANSGVQGAALSGASYRLRYMSDGSRASAQARQFIDLLGGTGTLEALAAVVGAPNTMPYFTGPGAAAATPLTPFARALLDDADAAAARATLGAQANLGYTPANKAGDTFTGDVNMAGWLRTGGNTNGRVRFVNNISVEAGYIGIGVLNGYGDSIGFDIANSTGGLFFGTNGATRMIILSDGSVYVVGTFSAGSKSFLIDHPLSPLDRNLRHISVEAPEYQIRYRGVATLEDGQATVDIDAACGMTPGTFAALATDAWVCSLQPQDSFERVKCSDVVDGEFTITSEDGGSTARVAWEVTARRKDPFVMHSPDSDADGRLIVDFEKPEAPNADD